MGIIIPHRGNSKWYWQCWARKGGEYSYMNSGLYGHYLVWNPNLTMDLGKFFNLHVPQLSRV